MVGPNAGSKANCSKIDWREVLTMRNRTISIPLDPETARAFGAVCAEEKLKIQALVSLWLRELIARELPSLRQMLRRRMQSVGAPALNRRARFADERRLIVLCSLYKCVPERIAVTSVAAAGGGRLSATRSHVRMRIRHFPLLTAAALAVALPFLGS
jgi:hypothetical protein